MESIETFEERMGSAMLADRFRFRRQLQRVRALERAGKDAGGVRERLAADLEASIQRLAQRRQSVPAISYPEELPVSQRRDEIIGLLGQHQVLVVSGATGSGKSTQLPKMCLEAGFGRSGMIGHTQPRRIAARSIAARVAEELGTSLGSSVGYKVRFGDQTSPETLVKLMTDGILLAETQGDRFLESYDAIIVDEAHERSLNIDFLLGYLRRLLERRRDLRVIITSATIDAVRFAEHFGDEHGPAPIVDVEGRNYPVEVRYRPAAADDDQREPDLPRQVIDALDELTREGPGDTLVFLPTERDIREVSRRLEGHLKKIGLADRYELLPLYARLSGAEQQRVFHPAGRRRIVLATNVAESSLTVPGIRYVIDSGTARISRYSPRSKVQRLPIEAVSRASADQRAGRCGRVGPGICVRLYSEEDYLSRDRYTTPEIRRTNLASVILQTEMLQLGAIDEFPFLDPPRPESIREGYKTLFEIGATDDSRRLTPIGRQLGTMPVDPRVGRMLIEADALGCVSDVLVIASALEVQDPRERPPERQQAADEAHAQFVDPQSDFLSYLRLWQFFRTQRENLSHNQLRKACRQNFLSYNRLREWADVHRQLREQVRELGRAGEGRNKGRRPRRAEQPRRPGEQPRGATDALPPDTQRTAEERYAAIHQALLTGLLSGVAMAGDKHEYKGAGGLELFLWPGSGVFEAKPKWIVAAELVETTRRYARTVGRIQPGWIEPLAGHLVKRSYSDAHWSQKTSSAFCYERVTLFGMPIVARRRVPLAPVDPETARRLLIEHGLVEGQLQTRAGFVRHNQALLEQLADLAAKTRDRTLVVDPYAVHRFYQERLPAEVVDRARLEQFDRRYPAPAWASGLENSAGLTAWLADPPRASDPETPYMRPEDLLPELPGAVDAEAFPDALEVGNTRLPLEYRFEPGTDSDGVVLTVPSAALPQVSDERLGWLVPGLIEEKLVALIKALPKRIRRNLVPAADTARRVAAELAPAYGRTPFMRAICEALSRHAEMPIGPADFDPQKLPQHLNFYVRVVDDAGETIATGREVAAIRQTLRVERPEELGRTLGEPPPPGDEELARDGLKTFDLDPLPKEVTRVRGGVDVAMYPAVVDLGETAGVRLFDHRDAADAAMRRGLMRLYAIAERKELLGQVRWLPELSRLEVLLASILSPASLRSQLVDLLARRAFVDGQPPARTREEFEARRKERGRRIAVATQEVAQWLPALAEAYHAARLELESAASGSQLAEAVADADQQLRALLPADFLLTTPWMWLEQFPRYLRAITHRLDKLRSGAQERDREATALVHHFWQAYQSHQETAEQARLEELRWMIEELRVSLFAQQLGTVVKVSPQRLEKLVAKLGMP